MRLRLKVNAEIVPEIVMCFKAYDTINGSQQQVGYCLVTVYSDEEKKPLITFGKKKRHRVATLWHIYVPSEHRRKGYARVLLDAVKKGCDEMITEVVTTYGANLLPSCWFKKDGLVWRWIK